MSMDSRVISVHWDLFRFDARSLEQKTNKKIQKDTTDMDDGKWWYKKVFVSLGIFSAIGWCYDILAMIPPDALHVFDCLLVVCVIDSSRVIPISFISFTSIPCPFLLLIFLLKVRWVVCYLFFFFFFLLFPLLCISNTPCSLGEDE